MVVPTHNDVEKPIANNYLTLLLKNQTLSKIIDCPQTFIKLHFSPQSHRKLQATP